jgi:hypothetical protein
MNKERRVNIIKALKNELSFYKRQPVQYTVMESNLKHLTLNTRIETDVIMNSNEIGLKNYLERRFSEQFTDAISSNKIPVKTEYDEYSRDCKITVDLYVKREESLWNEFKKQSKNQEQSKMERGDK